ncbi:MAG TPA: MBL fold metallo-hydrolase [Armatimonadota bacterium]|nr:MBL fold metallo-hydrolase [Armatimonadota bacterium]
MSRITCYDGVGCIGGNKILLEDGDSKLWLDFGLDFGRMGAYYEEYLKPKSCIGLYEPIEMGLLPPIKDLYRTDLLCELADPFAGVHAQEIGKVDGILLSHAHMDHIGSLHYVRQDIPIYCSAMTLAIAKVTQDTGGDQYCYTSPYEPSDTGELRAAYYGRNPSVAKQFVFVDETPSAEFNRFWGMTPSSMTEKGRKHEAVPITTTSKCGGLEIKRFPVDHSIYGASAWAIKTGGGWVVYTGDLRCHGTQASLTWKFAEDVAALKPRALIIEGTRIKDETTATEDEVKTLALDAVKKAKGLVIADFGPRNIERLVSFLEIAKETGRKLILLPKDAYLLEKMALAESGIPSLDDKSILIYNKYEAASQNWKKMIKEKYPEGKFVTAAQVAKNQDKAICCFSFFDINELAYIKPIPGSIWIYSSCEPFNEEMQIDFERLSHWLDKYDIEYLGGNAEDQGNPFHVSGHACQSDLLKLIDIISPEMVIPVHTEHADLYTSLLKGKCEVTLPARGMPIDL